ncbi:uncharacterized protein G2W53_012210 [Senna tora]|uniref:Uncharacterized protein n=1 Tax=Senna tora TaxID=362788 RepID=A0A834TXB4_9FABA|nr:uncharacterized protein G2W53_012210 [Senna tora]
MEEGKGNKQLKRERRGGNKRSWASYAMLEILSKFRNGVKEKKKCSARPSLNGLHPTQFTVPLIGLSFVNGFYYVRDLRFEIAYRLYSYLVTSSQEQEQGGVYCFYANTTLQFIHSSISRTMRGLHQSSLEAVPP